MKMILHEAVGMEQGCMRLVSLSKAIQEAQIIRIVEKDRQFLIPPGGYMI
jgi:hypothetical protein